MNVNPNNPPPQGFGTPLFEWLVANVLFLKRRLNGISTGGSGGSLAIGESVTGGLPKVVLFLDEAGNLTQTALFTYHDGELTLENQIIIGDGEGGSTINVVGIAPSGAPRIFSFPKVGSFNKQTLLFNADITADRVIILPDASGTVALEEWVTSELGDYLPLAGGTLSGVLNMGSNLISAVSTPVSDTDAANKSYVDTFVTGLSPKTAVRVATTGALTGSYNNGAGTFTMTATGVLAIDGVNLVLGNRVLIKNQAASLQNGIYDVTTEGEVGVATVFTRSSDNNTDAEMISAYTYTGAEGSTQANTGYVQSTAAPVIGTDPIIWNLFNSNAYNAATGIRIASNEIYATLSEGVTGGQDAIGGTAANDTFTLKGSSSTADRTNTNPAFLIKSMGPLAGTGAQVFERIETTINQNAGLGGGYTALKIAVTETSVGTGAKNLLDLLAGASGTTSKFRVDNTGTVQAGILPIARISATGTPDNTTYLRGDGSWSTVTANDGWTVYSLTGGDFTTSSTSLTNVTGFMTGILDVSSVYDIECYFNCSSSAGTAGLTVALQMAVTPTRFDMIYMGAATISSGGATISASNASDGASAAMFQQAGLQGIIRATGSVITSASANPFIQVRMRKVTSGSATMYADGYTCIKIKKRS